jgi:hypothetical protein
MADWTVTVSLAGLEYVETGPAVDIRESMSLLTRTPATRSASVTLSLPWDVARMEREGKKLEHATVSFEYNGKTVLEQSPRSVSAVSPDGPWKFSVTESTIGNSTTIPNERAASHAAAGSDLAARRQAFERATMQPVVSAATFSGAADAVAGLTYPVVFGSPGRRNVSGGEQVYAVPAYLVNVSGKSLLVAGHPVRAGAPIETILPVVNGTVAVRSRRTTASIWVKDSAGNTGVFDVLAVNDLSGRPVAYVNLAAATAGTGVADATYQYWTQWEQYAIGVPSGLGDLCEYLISHSALRMDWGLLRSARDQLNIVQLAGYIDQQINPLDLFSDVVSKILPATLGISSDGVYAAVWPIHATDKDVAFELYAGERFAYAAGPKTDYSAIYNEVTVEYGWSAEHQKYTYAKTYGPAVSPYAAWSAEHYGLKTADPIRAQFVYSHETADYIGLAFLKMAGGRRLDITYSADPARYGVGSEFEIYLGAPVSLTDADFGFTARFGVVGEIRRVNAELLITVSILEDPFI